MTADRPDYLRPVPAGAAGAAPAEDASLEDSGTPG